MNKKTWIVLGVVVLVFAGLIGITILQSSQESDRQDIATYDLDDIEEIYERIDYAKYDLDTVLNDNVDAGNLPENIKGDVKTAKVVIYEYADYQCSYCAAMNAYINQLVEDYGGKVAVVFRSYVLSYHDNGVAAASAANAAAIQGYWSEYKDLLFANQNDWFYSTGTELQDQLETYFLAASNNSGDIEKFRSDMASETVRQKVAFDLGAGEAVEIGGTPWFFLDGEWIENDNKTPAQYIQKIRDEIAKRL